ncbi:hypothetical protein HRG_005191 [Hirsutella rhossiliensis]|uniref:Uncharacterized protein n=1 Tax=Hirsutella rhossiliensis TaxID=111463 RepID=A0A9P8MYL8_9HYPO|nr:uncharacterized protein HRG_05191 [Hirsutella rhossiliensis]KAH0962681.1 hypothetical protein HRG_05191 [Hirsutella rhossiliensis]
MEGDAIKLPGADGFLAEGGPGNWSFSPQRRNRLVHLLRSKRYTRRADTLSTRLYTSLVDLFRMLLFYVDLQHTLSF